ncbi:hypothetical protein PASE110613_12570 [Paenibacillus sediminis]|uniref:Uncharacterized protein n=1 Tax=Paenibacillus sediminis TaxID=664909 RepID=A0ABS4H525_9BACL|nr:hypothetical protein [Paenibacillus sediminis]
MAVRTLQYGVVNLDYNSIVGLNYVGTTHQIDQDTGKVIRTGREDNDDMYFSEYNLSNNGGINYTKIGAHTAWNNPLVPGAPDIDYLATVEITNKSEVKTTLSLDKFPAYEGYISINGGKSVWGVHSWYLCQYTKLSTIMKLRRRELLLPPKR